MFCYGRKLWKSVIWGCKNNQNIEKIAFEVVQMKFLAMHISNQKYLQKEINTISSSNMIFN